MPRYINAIDEDNLITGKVGGFHFSGVRPDKLGATEYTLVTIVTDVTGSVASFADQLLECVKTVINACHKSPRANNLLIRYVTFNDSVTEKHGFLPLAQVDANQYSALHCSGGTALFDACYASVGASNDYAKQLYDQNFQVNSIIFVITDGADNTSKMAKTDVAVTLVEGVKAEWLDSSISILIGINTINCGNYLADFAKVVNFTQYIDVASVTDVSLAKLADFVSKSISSQSQSLGKGQNSQSVPTILTF